MPDSAQRLIVANFDCELEFARQNCPGPHKELPPKVRRGISRAAPALAAFANLGDSIWTMADITVAGTEQTLVTGAIQAEHFDAILPWGQTNALTALRKAPTETQQNWRDAIWHCIAAQGSAARCNDRRFAIQLNLPSPWTLPDRVAIDSLVMLDAYIAERPLGPNDAWIAKAPFAASGRERVRRHGRVLDGEIRVRAERLIQRYGELVIEPWMPRIADYGTTGLIGASEERTLIFPPHQLQSDGTGVFRGIRIADAETQEQLGSEFYEALQTTAAVVAQALFAQGYRGPFGIDSFVYTDHQGRKQIQSLCEINARLCFGLVARAQAEKLDLNVYDFKL